MRFILTAGQKGDAPQAAALIEGLPADVVIADTPMMPITCASDRRQGDARRHSHKPSRALKHPLDKHLYAQRQLVECCFSYATTVAAFIRLAMIRMMLRRLAANTSS